MSRKPAKMKTTDRQPKAPASTTFSSRIGTGKSLWLQGAANSRSQEGRRFRELVLSFSDDRGGMDGLTEAQRQLIRRAAALSLACEKSEAGLVASNEFDIGAYGTAVNTLSRVLAMLGIYRDERPALTLHEYLASVDEESALQADETDEPVGEDRGNE